MFNAFYTNFLMVNNCSELSSAQIADRIHGGPTNHNPRHLRQDKRNHVLFTAQERDSINLDGSYYLMNFCILRWVSQSKLQLGSSV